MSKYKLFDKLSDDFITMDEAYDFHTLYRTAIAFSECFIYKFKSTMVHRQWNFMTCIDDTYATELRYIVCAHIDVESKPIIRLASLGKLVGRDNLDSMIEKAQINGFEKKC